MKKFPALAITCLLCMEAISQNVGIGTSVPDSHAILHINSSNKGVLFPFVNLQSKTDNTTISGAPFGLMVMNTNIGMPNGRGLYFNAALVGGTPVWEPVGGMSLPYQGTTSTDQYAFQVNNTTGTVSSVGILGYASAGKGIYGSSNTGTGVYASSNAGLALEVNGKIKISGLSQSPGVGKVLTSDANGNATWEGAVAFASRGIQPDGAKDFASGERKKVAFYSEEYDLGNNYNPSSVSPYSTFTAPVAGIYHFEVSISWEENMAGSIRYLDLMSNYNGIIATKYQVFRHHEEDGSDMRMSVDIKLRTDEKIYVEAEQYCVLCNTTYSLFTSINKNWFTGRLVLKL